MQLPGETPEHFDIRINKDVAAFGYIWIMSIIVYAARRDSKFVHFHAKQGMVLFVLSILAGLIPYVGKYLVLVIFAGMALGFINAAQGVYRDVPYVGPLSRGELKLSQLLDGAITILQRIYDVFKTMFRRVQPPAKPVTQVPAVPVSSDPVTTPPPVSGPVDKP